MKWTEVVIKTSMENEDHVSDILYRAGATGLAIEDPNDILELSNNKDDWDFVDTDLIKGTMDQLVIKAYYSESQDLDSIKSFISENIKKTQLLESELFTSLCFNEVDDDDWAESWKKYYKPQRIGRDIVIKPSWEDFQEEEEDIIVELDPGMAFGTGTHETTIMCAEALESYVRPGLRVYDIGCGSGILSIIAAKLGAEKVVGVDLDPTCVKVSKENINLNNVEDRVEIIHGNLLDLVDEKADIIVANIVADVIIDMASDLGEYLWEDGIFIASGIILARLKTVEEGLISNGFKILDIKKLNEWACIIAKK